MTALLEVQTTGQTCDCGAQLVTPYRWDRLTPEHSAHLRTQNTHRQWRANKCEPCAKRANRRNRSAAEGPATTIYTAAELLAEWETLVDRNRTLVDNCRNIAPRLGMKSRTLERAVHRAGIRAWPV
jgi:hypothetical protein